MPRIDDEVVGEVHEEQEVVPQTKVPVQVTGQLAVNDGGVGAGARLLEHERVIVVVDVNHEAEALVALAVRRAARETIRRQLRRPELVQVDLRGERLPRGHRRKSR